MSKLKKFIKDSGLTMRTKRIERRDDGLMTGEMTHWECKIKRNGHTMMTYFSMGSALDGKRPDKEMVLSSLYFDISTTKNVDSFEEWSSELGYDTDSRRAERIYKAIGECESSLSWLLGGEYYYKFLNEVFDDDVAEGVDRECE